MKREEIEQLRQVKTLPSLIKYLRDELEWPIGPDAVEDDVTFTYSAEELGLEKEYEDIVKEIKQIRPLDSKQPWGIFWINFDKRRLPVVILRRILGHLGIKRRGGKKSAKQASWDKHDLLFISAYGEEHDRSVTFAHFSQNPDNQDDLPALKVLGWDDSDTIPHLADAHQTLKEKLRWPSDPSNSDAWRKDWSSAFTLRHREVIDTTEKLVEELAKLAKSIYKRAYTAIKKETAKGPLRRLHAAFKESLIHDLDEKDFADVIAQTISYGLLTARFSREENITVKNLVEMVPPTNPFLRELLGTFLHLAGRRGLFDFDELGIQDVVDLLNHANIKAIKNDFGNRARGEDPVIHFYEHFLSAYNREQKIQRGVFYTPQPVVSYIVRSVHELLQTEFGLDDGLASTVTWREMMKCNKGLKIPEGVEPNSAFVQILDPATGTATFLVEVIDVIHNAMVTKWKKQGMSEKQQVTSWNQYVPEHLLTRLHGYELMMAPYAIAHMKIGLKLQETGYSFGSAERARVYLTNALEPARDFSDRFAFEIPALAHEAQAVNAIKRHQCFTVFIGNPPYSFRSTNKSDFIMSLLEDYRKGLKERKPQLNDDYVKFIKLGQHLTSASSLAILGMITNNSYLYGVTHWRMRESLCGSFSTINILDLGGDIKLSSGTTPDENVFDIQQGVCIGLFIRKPADETKAKSFRMRGTRNDKYKALLDKGVLDQHYVSIKIKYPYCLTAEGAGLGGDYPKWPSLPEIFPSYINGIVTSRDGFCIDDNKSQLLARVHDFAFMPRKALLAKYESFDLRDNTSINILTAQKNLQKQPKRIEGCIKPCSFRPFDERVIAYDSNLIHRTREEIMGNLLRENIGLVFNRSIRGDAPEHFFIAKHVVMKELISSKDNCYVAPLFLYEQDQGGLFQHEDRRANITPKIIDWLKQVLQHNKTLDAPTAVFNYTYGVFHSPSYRSRYSEFLKNDFPHLPLTTNPELFLALARIGGELATLHLMESPKLDKHITKWVGDKNPEVEKVAWSEDTVWVDKDQSIGFKSVPEPVWNFHIGGYQVCDKWLKDRKGRKLSKDDIDHYQKIVVALSETIRIMVEIDKVINQHGGWPGAFTNKKGE